MGTFTSKFDVRDAVMIDGCSAIKGHVRQITLRSDLICIYEVVWMANSAHYSEWIDEWRLAHWKE